MLGMRRPSAGPAVARLKRIQGQQPGLADEQKGHVRAIIEAVAFRVQVALPPPSPGVARQDDFPASVRLGNPPEQT